MEVAAKSSATQGGPPFHTCQVMRRSGPNRVFAVIYVLALLALFYHHFLTLFFHSTTLSSTLLHLCLLTADVVLAFMWATVQSFRMRPVRRSQFPEKVERILKKSSSFPSLDVFICTADPHKEPPVGVVCTALSVMGFEYPAERVTIYVSDDGGSELTLFALMEGVKFGRHWLPFCRDKKIEVRSPDAFFRTNHTWDDETEKIKMMYQSMKDKIENVVERGKVIDDYITSKHERKAFDAWEVGFTRHDHPTVIQVLAESCQDTDMAGKVMPNLIYVSRQKSKASPHHFKAGALNTLLRVSAVMTNAPILLTLDCDMYSNDPRTLLRALCYFSDPAMSKTLGYIQFPQRFHGINKNDIYACENKRLFVANPIGMDGLKGPSYVGTGCFFSRRAFFGGPSSFVSPEIPELGPDIVADRPIQSPTVLALANRVADCNYENNTGWGSKMGFKYGSLVEDYYTGYRLQCEGWNSLFCNPERVAFLGDVPISLNDALSQCKRWCIGLLEVAISKYSTVTFGIRSMGPLMGLAYSHYAFWPFWSIPVTIYAFLPQIALFNGIPLFPKVSDAWFLLYAFLSLGAYGQDLIDFVSNDGTFHRWWSDQRMWMIKGLSCYLFSLVEFSSKSLGLQSHGFSLTSKVIDEQEGKRYEQGVFEFGVASPMFVPLTTAAVVNLSAFLWGIFELFCRGNVLTGQFVGQMTIAGYFVVNCWPVYEAMLFRSDKGKIPAKTTATSVSLAWALYTLVRFSVARTV